MDTGTGLDRDRKRGASRWTGMDIRYRHASGGWE
jgi:hypothetical protein